MGYTAPELQIIKFENEDVLDESVAVTPGDFEVPGGGIYF